MSYNMFFFPTQSLAERIIEDFESPSSEDDAPNHSHPPSPSSLLHLHPITVATATRTRTRPLIGRGLPVSPIDCASTPEDMRITTPPSSPEVVASVSDFNRTKASDWIKQVQLESAESIGGDPNDTAKTPHHCLHQHQCQSESSKRAGRTKKFIPGGLAEQLQRVSRSEASEVTVWEHRVRRLEGKDAGEGLVKNLLKVTLLAQYLHAYFLYIDSKYLHTPNVQLV